MVNDQEMYEILCEMKNIGGILGVHYENGPVLNGLGLPDIPARNGIQKLGRAS